jgi:predicted metal-dependent peptidase
MFYAEMISQMRRIVNYRLPAAAGVCIKDQIELHINPHGMDVMGQDGEPRHIPGFCEQPMEARVAILIHECEHIFRDHIGRMKEIVPEAFSKQQDIVDQLINSQKFKAMNIAADLAINPGVINMPAWACFPKNFNLKDGETFEWYLDELKNNERMKQLTEYDSHSLWTESDGDKEVVKEKIRQAINKAAKRTRQAGKMTAGNEMIVDGFNEASICWKQQLRRFVAHAIEVKVESSRKKRNRRYGIVFPGSIKLEELHLGVAKDSSGSVSDEAYAQFMNEIDSIAKYAKITMIDVDTEVKSSEVYKKGQPRRRRGYGGTAYQPAFDYFNEDKTIDAVIYFGDMDAYDKPTKPRYPVLWSIVGNQDPPADFGGRVYIKIKEEV